MDKLSRFGGGGNEVSLISKEGKTLDDLIVGLESVVGGQGRQLLQSQLTHLGHEAELWGQEFRVDENDIGIEELNESGNSS